MVSVTNDQLYSVEELVLNIWMNEHGSGPIKLYL